MAAVWICTSGQQLVEAIGVNRIVQWRQIEWVLTSKRGDILNDLVRWAFRSDPPGAHRVVRFVVLTGIYAGHTLNYSEGVCCFRSEIELAPINTFCANASEYTSDTVGHNVLVADDLRGVSAGDEPLRHQPAGDYHEPVFEPLTEDSAFLTVVWIDRADENGSSIDQQ